jgi:septum formation protein
MRGARDAQASRGRTHEVISGLCLRVDGGEEVGRSVTLVTFRNLTEHEIDEYVEAGEWQGRASGYAVQGFGASLVERIEGDYLNVVGLPGALLLRMLLTALRASYGDRRDACRLSAAPP